MSVPKPNAQIRYVQPDGRLTPQGMDLFLRWVAEVNRLATVSADHEDRITALEP